MLLVPCRVGIAFVDVSGLDWDEDKPTIMHTPAFDFVELPDEWIEIELPEWEQSIEIDLLFLEPDLS